MQSSPHPTRRRLRPFCTLTLAAAAPNALEARAPNGQAVAYVGTQCNSESIVEIQAIGAGSFSGCSAPINAQSFIYVLYVRCSIFPSIYSST